MAEKIANTISSCRIVDLQKVNFRAGNITVLENNISLPFEINRVFYLYDIPGGEDRGAHAHKSCHQLLVAVSGSFDVFLDDGVNIKTISLNRPYFGLHIPPGIWAAEQSFSSGAICLVLTSHKYDENDYIRNYQAFLNSKEHKRVLS
nr:WxcM-like domain-containing protein [Bacteroidota bacterium]